MTIEEQSLFKVDSTCNSLLVSDLSDSSQQAVMFLLLKVLKAFAAVSDFSHLPQSY